MARFAAEDRVRIATGYPLGHCRTPWYARGQTGVIERHCGDFPNPEELAYGRDGLPAVPLYRVRLGIDAIWPDRSDADRPDADRPGADTLEVEIFEHWLTAAEEF